MSRDDLLDLLTRAVMDGMLTEAEARDLIARLDAGTLPATPLPLPPQEGIRSLDDETIILAAVLAYAFTHVALLANFDRVARVIAPQATTNLPRWQTRMSTTIRSHLAAQGMVAANRIPPSSSSTPLVIPPTTPANAQAAQSLLPPSQRGVVDQAAMTQTAFLSRFADTVAVTQLQHRPMTTPAVAARAAQYAGAGTVVYYTIREADATAGWVVDYQALDDQSTCDPCLAAERGGPYLPGQGPMPGEVCLGRGNCRCRRQMRYDPKAYAALTGTPVP